MNEIDRGQPSPLGGRSGRAVAAAAVFVVLTGVLAVTLVAAPSSPGQVEATPEPPPETFAAIAPIVVEPSASASPPPSMAPSLAAPSPSASPAASPSPIVDPNHVATRVRVPALAIDLAVVAPPRSLNEYPKCNVAMYIAKLHQPGQDRATYLYAHARAGMFLPIYERAIQRLHGGPRSMLGMSVEVYTSDDLRYLYTIKEVRVHQTTLTDAARARSDELWLQTSEGPRGTRGKTQLRAVAVGVQGATHQQAHPVAKPVTCA